MPKSTRSVAIELHENAAAIEAWRTTLPEKQRRRLVHPLSNVRRWRAATAHGNGKCPQDLKREAAVAWRRFEVRQLGDVRRNPPRLVLAEQFGIRRPGSLS